MADAAPVDPMPEPENLKAPANLEAATRNNRAHAQCIDGWQTLKEWVRQTR